ncbi:amino acid permease [Corynebacterium tapiri]|uniref:Amino acid permease n=1 Tax=Corynebacterium tapiri TaxID=1448266 RepID=A0A5C4U538_9CORY|nr:aromatic amino acid transport family protein [Corynebacterium tapiri]TNL99390.1 amino acid permease [Corynebacterium tapiri]
MEQSSNETAEHLEGEQPEGTSSSIWTWVLTLFGTAVGAGLLFLPISAGSFGFWPLAIMTILIGPIVFISHRTYSRIITVSGTTGMDILEVVTYLTGRKRGLVVALLYWLANYPTLVIYCISVTNTVDSFITNQLHGPDLSRPVVAVLCVGTVTAAAAFGLKPMLAFANMLVYPLIVSLLAFSLFLIPKWDPGSFTSYPAEHSLPVALILMLPVLVFSFSHMGAISQLAIDVQRSHPENMEKRVSRTDAIAVTLLVAFTMFFVWSCALAMGADGLTQAKNENLPVLSYFANTTGSGFLTYLAPLVTMCAIATSFFGIMLGTEEATTYPFRVVFPETMEKINPRVISLSFAAFVFVTGTLITIMNPPIMGLISFIGGVIFALLVNMLPLALFMKVKRLRPYAKRPETIVAFIIGVILVATTVTTTLLGISA